MLHGTTPTPEFIRQLKAEQPNLRGEASLLNELATKFAEKSKESTLDDVYAEAQKTERRYGRNSDIYDLLNYTLFSSIFVILLKAIDDGIFGFGTLAGVAIGLGTALLKKHLGGKVLAANSLQKVSEQKGYNPFHL